MTQADFDGSQVKLVWQLQLVFETELVAFGILSQLKNACLANPIVGSSAPASNPHECIYGIAFDTAVCTLIDATALAVEECRLRFGYRSDRQITIGGRAQRNVSRRGDVIAKHIQPKLFRWEVEER